MGYSTIQYGMDFLLNSPVMAESWASCVENVITSDIYNEEWENLQSHTISEMKDGYTSLFIDLMDNFNQRVEYGNEYPNDRVNGYILKQLETALDKTYLDLDVYTPAAEVLKMPVESFGMKIFKNKLKKLYNNQTEDYLDELFNNFDFK